MKCYQLSIFGDGSRKNMLSENHIRKMLDNERMAEHIGKFHPVVEQWLRWESKKFESHDTRE